MEILSDVCVLYKPGEFSQPCREGGEQLVFDKCWTEYKQWWKQNANSLYFLITLLASIFSRI